MITLIRIALGMAWDRSTEQRWRQVSMIASAFAAMICVLAAASVVTMTADEHARSSAREAHISTSRADSDLFVVVGLDEIEDKQFFVYWVEPASAGAEDNAAPLGAEELPLPGQAVVSPALDRLLSESPELSGRYRDRRVLGWQGVRSGGELIAYIRPTRGRTLGDTDKALEIRDGAFAGEGPAIRVSGFGPRAEDKRAIGLGEDPPAIGEVAAGVTALLVVPGLIILAVGTRSGSAARDRRLAILRAIGVSEPKLRMLSIAEALALAVPGLLAASVLWGAVSPRMTSVPLVGYEVVPGDLGLPWWSLLLAFAGAAGVAAAMSFQTQPAHKIADSTPRPVARQARLSKVRLVPLGVAIVAFIAGSAVGGYDLPAYFNMAGLISAVVAAPVIAPVVLPRTGAMLAESRAIARSIAGRALQHDPAGASRPFVAAAALIVLVLAGIGYATLSRSETGPAVLSAGAEEAVFAEWLDAQAGDVDRLADAVGADLAAPVSFDAPDYEHGPEGRGELTIGAACSELATVVPGVTCDMRDEFTLSPESSDRLAAAFSARELGGFASVNLVPRANLIDASKALFVDDVPIEDLTRRVRNATVSLVVAPNVKTTYVGETFESPLVPWLLGGFIALTVGLGLACLLSMVDRLLVARSHQRLLINIGIPAGQLIRLGAWMFAAPFTAVIGMSLAIGVIVVAFMLYPGGPMPWTPIGVVVAISAGIGTMGVASVALLGGRRAYRAPE